MREQIEAYPVERDAKLAEIVRRLADAYRPLAIYLFGSKARGDAGADSDYDLLVVVTDDAPAERRRSRLAYQALRGTAVAADVIVCTRSHFEARRQARGGCRGGRVGRAPLDRHGLHRAQAR